MQKVCQWFMDCCHVGVRCSTVIPFVFLKKETKDQAKLIELGEKYIGSSCKLLVLLHSAERNGRAQSKWDDVETNSQASKNRKALHKLGYKGTVQIKQAKFEQCSKTKTA
jgi:hypothetical protein